MTGSGPWRWTAGIAQRSHRDEGWTADRSVEQLSQTRDDGRRGSFRDGLIHDVKVAAFQRVAVVRGDAVGAPAGIDRSAQCLEFDHRAVRREQMSMSDGALVGPVVAGLTHALPLCGGVRPERREHTAATSSTPISASQAWSYPWNGLLAVIALSSVINLRLLSRQAALRMTSGR
jgi:hypothetical protein